ncbi:MAG: dipeptidase PepE [Ginsengibacter sp.]
MTKEKILAFSSSRSGNSGFLEKAFQVIKDFLGNEPTNIAFFPFASVDQNYEGYADAVRNAIYGSGITIKTVLPSGAISVLENADAIMVGGGNTFKLLHDLYELKLLDLMREKLMNGAPYIGWSAGSNILSPTISTTNDMPIIQPQSFKSLEIFPFQLNPHYFNKKIEGFNGETRDDRLSEFVRMNPGVPVVALPEGTYLRLENGVLKFFGEEAFIFSEANNPEGYTKRQICANDDLSFLLKQQ